MRGIRKLVLLCCLALAAGASMASSAGALTAYDQGTGAALPVGATINGVTTGTMTLSGNFYGFSVTITCLSVVFQGAIVANGGSTVKASITSMTFNTCSSTLRSPCLVTTTGSPPWTPSGNSGGLVATGVTAVGLAPGTTGYIDVENCINGLGVCTITGATASYGGLSNVIVGTWSNTSPQFVLNTGIAGKSCTVSGSSWKASFSVRSAASTNLVGLRTP